MRMLSIKAILLAAGPVVLSRVADTQSLVMRRVCLVQMILGPREVLRRLNCH